VTGFGTSGVEHCCLAIKLQLLSEFNCSISDHAGLIQNVLLVYAKRQCMYMYCLDIL
jgi:hypothetical protein